MKKTKIETFKREESVEISIYKIDKDRYQIKSNSGFENCIIDMRFKNKSKQYYVELIKTVLDYKGDTFIEKCKDRFYLTPKLVKNLLHTHIPEKLFNKVFVKLHNERRRFIENLISCEDYNKRWLKEEEWLVWVAFNGFHIYETLK